MRNRTSDRILQYEEYQRAIVVLGVDATKEEGKEDPVVARGHPRARCEPEQPRSARETPSRGEYRLGDKSTHTRSLHFQLWKE